MKTLEPMRSALPNTDQPRTHHSEYHYNWRRRQDGVPLHLAIATCVPRIRVLSVKRNLVST